MAKNELIEKIRDSLTKKRQDLYSCYSGTKDASINADGPMQLTYDTTKKEQGWLADAIAIRVSQLDQTIACLDRAIHGVADETGVGRVVRVQYASDPSPVDCILLPEGGSLDFDEIEELDVMAISVLSPLGNAIVSAKPGETLQIQTPGGVQEIRVLEV